MNREIKFRVWDVIEEKMFENTDALTYMLNEINGAHIMQFTGLHDKNGKEIYEGDILIHKQSNPCKLICKYYEDGIYRTGLGLFYISGKPYNNSTGLYYEIIGNIYQNPNLLNN